MAGGAAQVFRGAGGGVKTVDVASLKGRLLIFGIAVFDHLFWLEVIPLSAQEIRKTFITTSSIYLTVQNIEKGFYTEKVFSLIKDSRVLSRSSRYKQTVCSDWKNVCRVSSHRAGPLTDQNVAFEFQDFGSQLGQCSADWQGWPAYLMVIINCYNSHGNVLMWEMTDQHLLV